MSSTGRGASRDRRVSCEAAAAAACRRARARAARQLREALFSSAKFRLRLEYCCDAKTTLRLFAKTTRGGFQEAPLLNMYAVVVKNKRRHPVQYMY